MSSSSTNNKNCNASETIIDTASGIASAGSMAAAGIASASIASISIVGILGAFISSILGNGDNVIPSSLDDFQEIRRRNLKRLLEDDPSSITQLSSSRSYISQLVNGKTSFGDKAARKIEEELGLEKNVLDRDEDLQNKIQSRIQEELSKDNNLQKQLEYITYSKETPLTPIDKQYSEPRRKCAEDDLANKTLLSTLVSSNMVLESMLKNENAASTSFIISPNDTMSPSINKNDVVVVDNSITQYQGEGVYYFEFNNEMYIRELKKNFMGQLMIKSPNEEFTLDNTQTEKLKIKGRCSKSLKLSIQEL